MNRNRDAAGGDRRRVHPHIHARPRHFSHVVGMSAEEGQGLCDELEAYIKKDEIVYTHEWRSQDLIVWDNLKLQHARNSRIMVEQAKGVFAERHAVSMDVAFDSLRRHVLLGTANLAGCYLISRRWTSS